MQALAWRLAIAVLALRSATAASAPPAGAPAYRITGTVVSTRGGAPVPFCRISAAPSSATPTRTIQPAPVSALPDRFIRGSQVSPVFQPGRATRPGPGGTLARSPRTADANGYPETRADSSGRFSLDLPHMGSWRLAAVARGFRSQAFDEHDGFFSSIVLSEASPTYEAGFQLTPDAIISGLVLDEAGEPVRNAQVTAELIPALVAGESRGSSSARPRQAGNAQTDDRGRYELPGLAPAAYQLRVQAQPWYAAGMRGGFRGGGIGAVAGFGGTVSPPNVAPSPDPSLDMVYAPTWYPAASAQNEAETIPLAGGEERQVDFHLTAIPAAHLAIARPDAPQPEPGDDRRPRQGTPLFITRVGSEGLFGTSFLNGGGGNFDVGGLAPGTYEVRLPGARGDREGDTVQVEVRPGATGPITLENAKPLAKVSIQVDGLPEGQLGFVEFFDKGTGRRIMASPSPRGRRGAPRDDTADDGDPGDPQPTVMIAMLPPHTYDVTVNGGSGTYLTGISATGARVLGHTVAIGGAATLSLHLANTRGQIAGFVHTPALPAAKAPAQSPAQTSVQSSVQANPQPVSGAMVLLVPTTLGQPGDLTPILRDQSNTDGSFDLQAVVPGRYILVAIDHGWRVDWHDPATLAGYLAHGLPVEVKGSAKLREQLDIVLP